MNITLSADAELIKKSRQMAKEKGTSLNQAIRDYLVQYVNDQTSTSAADEFEQLVRESSGRSPEGYQFNRGDVHKRR